jgi:hypothetical protein
MKMRAVRAGVVGGVALLALDGGGSAWAADSFRSSVQTRLYTAEEHPRDDELAFRERCRLEAESVAARLREIEVELGEGAEGAFEARTARVESGGVDECWLLVKSRSEEFGVRHRAGATHRGRRTLEACATELESLRALPGVLVSRVERWADLFRVACRATAVQVRRRTPNER